MESLSQLGHTVKLDGVGNKGRKFCYYFCEGVELEHKHLSRHFMIGYVAFVFAPVVAEASQMN